jgi:hypothetical protein
MNYILEIRWSLWQAKKESQTIEKHKACGEIDGEEFKEEPFIKFETLIRGGNFEYIPHKKQNQSVPVASHINNTLQEQLSMVISLLRAYKNKEEASYNDYLSKALPLDHLSSRMMQNDLEDDFASHPPHDSIDKTNPQGVNKLPFKLPKANNKSLDDSLETALTTTATMVDSLPTIRQRRIFGSQVTTSYIG